MFLAAGEGVSSTADIEFGTGNFVNEVPAVVGNPLVLRYIEHSPFSLNASLCYRSLWFVFL